MQNDRMAKVVHLLSNLVIAINVTVLVALILLDIRLPLNTTSVLITLTTLSLVILAALEQKYTRTPRKQTDPKQMILAGTLGALIILAAILLKNFLDAAQ